MDLDAYVAEHEGEWRRLEQLLGRRRLTGQESDELIALYQRAATHLSAVQSRAPDPALVGRLSRLVARARSAVTGSTAPSLVTFARFFTVGFPVAVYRAWPWWCGVATAFSAVAFGMIAWFGTHPALARQLAPDSVLKQLVEHEFADYYSENPSQDFAAQVWTNNALIAALCLFSGVLIFPVLIVLFENAVNVGEIGGVMVAYGRTDVFFGLITPHGLLELTAVFVAAGAGLRIGWSWIAPGRGRTRSQALAETSRAAVLIALGLVVVLAISGVIEAFVTPSGLPTWARISIGVAAFAGFLAYVVVLGGRAARAGETGDLAVGEREDLAPTV
ncbi:stage II sporulation protein M [Cryptosporangium phraense]|uniref:Stage II sporulation protein M n=1 Tax=Cryptosporangium phraense TaxID=2593070 RepID=A0A545AGT5_9ACTN|nr:stage II sporulation protein M [Cryptosporangium phraense]TQS40539.1 stage II sporulation protein M [Cryptosporangium phraense]